MKFKLGDRVRIKNQLTASLEGLSGNGTIRVIEDELFGIEFDKSFLHGHGCDGSCKPGYGYWLRKDRIVSANINWKKRLGDKK